MEYICKYCGKVCKNKNSLIQHEIRCKENPDRINCCGNKGNMPKITNAFLKRYAKMKNGDIIDITNEELIKYLEEHKNCEICDKTIEETNKWISKFSHKRLCIDHQHKTNHFRGVLCSNCNRQLGWFEKNEDKIKTYLKRNKN